MHSPGPIEPKIEAAFRTEGLVLREVRYVSGYQMPLHDHKFAHLFFCLKGTVQHDFRKQTRFIRPAMLAFLPAGEPHANHFYQEVRTFDVVLESYWAERFQQYSALVDKPVDYPDGLPSWLATRLHREFRHPDSLTPLMLEGLTLELLSEMSRDPSNRAETPLPRWLNQARDFLHAHFTESVSLETVAVAVGVHPAHLTRVFRRHFHVTIGDYVRKLRVEYACHLLSNSDTSLSQIALDAGFADQGHFSRTFKRLGGMTPTEFRKVSGRAGLR